MFIASIETAHPPHYYDQEDLLNAFQETWNQQHHNPRRVEQLHRAVQVSGRHLALSKEEYHQLDNFTDSNDQYIRVGTDVGEKAVRRALDSAGLSPTDVDAIFFVSVTGVATPSIDARLVNRLGMRSDVKRIPIFGLGCVAGAAGLARVRGLEEREHAVAPMADVGPQIGRAAVRDVDEPRGVAQPSYRLGLVAVREV